MWVQLSEDIDSTYDGEPEALKDRIKQHIGKDCFYTDPKRKESDYELPRFDVSGLTW